MNSCACYFVIDSVINVRTLILKMSLMTMVCFVIIFCDLFVPINFLVFDIYA